jgi:Pyruvate/2-oxoacid:ferredoxin oxidoreductase delta subunit
LLQMVDVTKGVGPGGTILLDYLAQDDRRPLEGPFRIAAVDARSIALEYGLGTKIAPIVNTVILGAFAKIAGDLNLEHLITAIKASVPINPEQNAAAAHASYSAVHWIQGQPAASLESPVQPKTAIQCFAELPTLPETRGVIDWNQTGTWRYLTPVAANKLPPCRSNCPAGMPIPEIVQAVSQGHSLRALELVFSANPLPGLTGNLCYHPCQIDCLRRKIDRPLAIQHLERFIAAQDCCPSIENPPKTSARVAVVGAGPIGLTCGHFLGCSGYRVVVLAAEPQPGGALLGLSPEKLDPQILKLEIERLVRLSNIELRLGVSIDRNLLTELQSGFDLVIVDPSELADISPVKDVVLGFMKSEAGKNNIKVILPDLSKELKPFKYSLIAHYVAVGRRIAHEADSYLAGQNRPSPAAQSISSADNAAPSLMSFNPAQIRIERFPADSSRPPKTLGKGMVMDGGQALAEACRCLSCGTCNLCLQCISSCPDVSIHHSRTSTGVTFDLHHCKGCGICAHECPRGVISMEKIIS